MQKNKIFLVIFWTLVLGLFGMVGFCIWQIKDYKQVIMDEVFVIYLTALITTSILLLLALLFFFFRFCFKGAYKIGQIYKIVKGKKRRVSRKTDRLSYRRNNSSIRVVNIEWFKSVDFFPIYWIFGLFEIFNHHLVVDPSWWNFERPFNLGREHRCW